LIGRFQGFIDSLLLHHGFFNVFRFFIEDNIFTCGAGRSDQKGQAVFRADLKGPDAGENRRGI